LGGSLGLAVGSALPGVRRVGYSHREVTVGKALELGVIDESCSTVAQAVRGARLVVLASPIGTFEEIMRKMDGHLAAGCIVTDVGSTKVLPVRLAGKYLRGDVEFVGSHPMAGSEQRGVEFSRGDLFFGARCIVTPTAKVKKQTVKFLEEFWTSIGMRVSHMTATRHDRVMGRISHLPHILAMSLLNISDPEQMLLCGKGFLDTTRIASGPINVWRDILTANAGNTEAAIGKLIKELAKAQKVLRQGDGKAIERLLGKAREKRNDLVEKKIQQGELL